MRGERLAPPIGTFQALHMVTREATAGIGPDRRRAIELPDGSMRSFLEGGDDVVLRGASGLGEASGTVEPARC
jgi:hypothetical protein